MPWSTVSSKLLRAVDHLLKGDTARDIRSIRYHNSSGCLKRTRKCRCAIWWIPVRTTRWSTPSARCWPTVWWIGGSWRRVKACCRLRPGRNWCCDTRGRGRGTSSSWSHRKAGTRYDTDGILYKRGRAWVLYAIFGRGGECATATTACILGSLVNSSSKFWSELTVEVKHRARTRYKGGCSARLLTIVSLQIHICECRDLQHRLAELQLEYYLAKTQLQESRCWKRMERANTLCAKLGGSWRPAIWKIERSKVLQDRSQPFHFPITMNTAKPHRFHKRRKEEKSAGSMSSTEIVMKLRFWKAQANYRYRTTAPVTHARNSSSRQQRPNPPELSTTVAMISRLSQFSVQCLMGVRWPRSRYAERCFRWGFWWRAWGCVFDSKVMWLQKYAIADLLFLIMPWYWSGF